MRASKHDPSKPRYARVPSGAKTCAFCAMLASRGFVYASEDKAGALGQYHKDCDCEIIPSWDRKNPKIEGYDPDGCTGSISRPVIPWNPNSPRSRKSSRP